jgi:hypothetical protein
MPPEIRVPDEPCECCSCIEINLLETPACTIATPEVYTIMRGHRDLPVGTVLKIGSHCWQITDNPAFPCTNAVPELGEVGSCPDDCDEEPIPSCWFLWGCPGTGGSIITTTDVSAHLHKVLRKAGTDDCYWVLFETPCVGAVEFAWDAVFDDCEDCESPPCCTCGDCQFEDPAEGVSDSTVDYIEWHYDFGIGCTPCVTRAPGLTLDPSCGSFSGNFTQTNDPIPFDPCFGKEGSSEIDSGSIEIKWDCSQNRWERDDAPIFGIAGGFSSDITEDCCGSTQTENNCATTGIYVRRSVVVNDDSCCATAPPP